MTPVTAPLVSVIIATRDRKKKLLRLIDSIRASDYPMALLEIIVVDNASSDGTPEAVAVAFPDVRIVRSTTNLYCGGGRNAGMAVARGAYLFCVDDDNILNPACISQLVDAMEADQRIGIAAPLMLRYGSGGVIWCAGGKVDRWGRLSHLFGGLRVSDIALPPLIEAEYFPNACMLRAGLFQEGLRFDAAAFPHNWTEVDLGARARRAGLLLRTVTAAVTQHDIGYVGPLTRIGVDKTLDQARARVRYRRRYIHSGLQWAVFVLVVLPVSTAVYLHAFIVQREEPFLRLLGAYLRGTIEGFRGRV